MRHARRSLFVLVIVSHTLSGFAGISFQPPTSYAVEADPAAAAVADFDRNGWLDLAVANITSETVSILLNQGGGAFAAQAPFFSDFNPGSICALDLNLDQWPDLAVGKDVVSADAPGSGVLSIHLNNGDGTFGPEVDYYPKDNVVRSVIPADFTGDGRPDIAAMSRGGTVTIYRSLGNGAIAHFARFFPVPSMSMVVGDMDGNGWPDLAIPRYSLPNPTEWYRVWNEGAGVFTMSGPDVSQLTGNAALGLADFDGLGGLDIVAVTLSLFSSSPGMAFHKNEGSRNFGVVSPPVVYTTPAYAGSSGRPETTASDYDLDGDVDLAWLDSGAASLTIAVNRGGGIFGDGPNQPADTVTIPLPVRGSALISADLDKNGSPDLVVCHALTDSVTVLLNVNFVPTASRGWEIYR